MSSTATTTPLPPGAPSAATFDHACGAFTPNGPAKFHCSCCQSPAALPAPRSFGNQRRPRRPGARGSRAPPRARRARPRRRRSAAPTLTPRREAAARRVCGAVTRAGRPLRQRSRSRRATRGRRRRVLDEDASRRVRALGAGCRARDSAPRPRRQRTSRRAAAGGGYALGGESRWSREACAVIGNDDALRRSAGGTHCRRAPGADR